MNRWLEIWREGVCSSNMTRVVNSVALIQCYAIMLGCRSLTKDSLSFLSLLSISDTRGYIFLSSLCRFSCWVSVWLKVTWSVETCCLSYFERGNERKKERNKRESCWRVCFQERHRSSLWTFLFCLFVNSVILCRRFCRKLSSSLFSPVSSIKCCATLTTHS